MGKRGPVAEHTERLHIMMPPELKVQLEATARDQGMTVSELVREILVEALELSHFRLLMKDRDS